MEATNSDVWDDSPGDVNVGPDDGKVGSFGNSDADEVETDVTLPLLVPELSLIAGDPGSLDIIELLEIMPSIVVVGRSPVALLVIMSMVDD